MQNFIEIQDLNITYENKIIFDHFSLQIKQGDALGIQAPTGKGKTTLLNHIAQNYYDKMKISYAYQDNRLLQKKTVLQNINFIIPKQNRSQHIHHSQHSQLSQQNKHKNQPFSKNTTQIEQLLQEFDLTKQKNTPCRLLSGGEQQRVNLARAFAFAPDLFLLDEPFSAQDFTHKQQLFSIIRRRIIEQNKTMILVSHNPADLKTLCTKIITL